LLDVTIARLAGRGAGRIEFSGAVQYSQISEFLADTAVGVFPSYWENFPYVCLEAMAAGCGVIGSSCGGMAEIIEHGRTGLLVPPRNPRVIAEALIELLRDPARRAAMGAAARAHVVQAYSAEAIAPLQEASYARAIARARQRLAGRTRRTADKVVST
jgi:glycosyltransferase involved in cell wall biosynthesis